MGCKSSRCCDVVRPWAQFADRLFAVRFLNLYADRPRRYEGPVELTMYVQRAALYGRAARGGHAGAKGAARASKQIPRTSC